jgi:hypothetical protein
LKSNTKLSLPHTPEEYTLWTLEFAEGWYDYFCDLPNIRLQTSRVYEWIQYTVEEYPEYITVDLRTSYVNLWICGIFIATVAARTHIELMRDIIDCNKCKTRIGSRRVKENYNETS